MKNPNWQQQKVKAMKLIDQKAAEMFPTLSHGERFGLGFGMFPADKLLPAEAALNAEINGDGEVMSIMDISRLLAVALMDLATKGK